jgi:hypothetical protein
MANSFAKLLAVAMIAASLAGCSFVSPAPDGDKPSKRIPCACNGAIVSPDVAKG